MIRFLTTHLWSLALVVGLGSMLGLGQAAAAQPADPASVALAYFREFPGDDALELFADDAVMRIIPPLPNTTGVWTGKAEIGQLAQLARGQNLRMEVVGSPSVDGNKVTVRTMNHTDLFRQLGVSPVEHAYEFVVEGGKITSLVSAMTPAEQERVGAARAAAQQAQPAAPAGMPRTGVASVLTLVALIAVSLLALTAGVALRVRKARETRCFS